MRIELPYKKVELVLKTEVPLPELVRRLVSAYGLEPYDINNGNCDYFAEDFLFAAKKLGISGKFFVTPESQNLPGHCWQELSIFKKCLSGSA